MDHGSDLFLSSRSSPAGYLDEEKKDAKVPRMAEIGGEGGSGIGVLPLVLAVAIAIAAYMYYQQ